MLDSIFSSITSETLTISRMLFTLGVSLSLGFLISLFYLKTHQEDRSNGFAFTLIMMPSVISVIIMMIGTNIAGAFSLGGAFSLIRFRSEAGEPRDISYVFFALGVGLACGMGYIGYAVVFAGVMCLVMAVLHQTGFGKPDSGSMQLKITVPEDYNYSGIFDDILGKYTDKWHLKRVKTTDFGTLFELTYIISLRPGASEKQMIDELRCRNSNLNISLILREYEERSFA